MEIRKLISDLESLTLPASEWNHTAHLRIALWYVYTVLGSLVIFVIIVSPFMAEAMRQLGHGLPEIFSAY